MVLEKVERPSLYLGKVSGLIKTDMLTSKVLTQGLKRIVKLEGMDEKKEPFEKTKIISIPLRKALKYMLIILI